MKTCIWTTVQILFHLHPYYPDRKGTLLDPRVGWGCGGTANTNQRARINNRGIYSEHTVSLPIWKAGLLTCTQLSYGNHNICCIPVGKGGLMRQPTKKATALQFLKNKRNSNYTEYMFNSYIATEVGVLVQNITRRQQFTRWHVKKKPTKNASLPCPLLWKTDYKRLL